MRVFALHSRRRPRRLRGDAGMTMLESMVAILIAGMIFSALGLTALNGIRAGVIARQSQQAADLANKEIERVRAMDYAGVSLLTADLTGDLCPASGIDRGCVRQTASGGYEHLVGANWEPVVAGAVGLIPQHVQTISSQGASYTVKTYVTRPAGTTAANSPKYRRVSVVVSWSVGGQVRVRRSSSAFTDTRRGLPLPRFSFGTPVTVKTNVGAYLAIPATLTNVGAPDAFNLSASAPPTGSGPWSWYLDDGPSLKAFDLPTSLGGTTPSDNLLTDTDFDTSSLPDTNIVQPNATVQLLLVRRVVAGEPATQSTTLTARSAAQPSAATAVHSFTVNIGVDPSSCSATACTFATYKLHNKLGGGDSTTITPMLMDVNPVFGGAGLLPNYSTEVVPAQPGRHVAAGGAPNESNGSRVAVWYKQVPRATTLQGTASIRVWARIADGVADVNGDGIADGAQLTAYIGSDQNSNQITGFSPGGTGWVMLPPLTDTSWHLVTISVNIPNAFTVANSKYLAVRIVGNRDIRLAYDTGVHPADVTLPVSQGCPC